MSSLRSKQRWNLHIPLFKSIAFVAILFAISPSRDAPTRENARAAVQTCRMMLNGEKERQKQMEDSLEPPYGFIHHIEEGEKRGRLASTRRRQGHPGNIAGRFPIILSVSWHLRVHSCLSSLKLPYRYLNPSHLLST